jgi:hypothetical protein
MNTDQPTRHRRGDHLGMPFVEALRNAAQSFVEALRNASQAFADLPIVFPAPANLATRQPTNHNSQDHRLNLPNFYGFPVYIDDTLGRKFTREQHRFPRSKRKRIRRKWQKDRRNYWVTWTARPVAHRVGRCLVMNTIAFEELKKDIANKTAAALRIPIEIPTHK